jgi:hypothetical protein
MSTKTTEPRRSALMRVMRLSPGPIVLSWAVGGLLMAAGAGAWRGVEAGQREVLWDVGYSVLVLGGTLFVVVLWGGVYLEVVEASRGSPGLRSVGEPEMPPEAASKLRVLEQELSGLGFRHDGWFSLDNFGEMRVSAWQHEDHPAVAFILHLPGSGAFRLRFVRRFASGGVLVSTTRLVDLACLPPEGVYVQMRKGDSASELWAWHLEAESLFPDRDSLSPDDGETVGPRELYVALSTRWAKHKRRDRTWLLAVEPCGEAWRMYHLCGMPLARQFELGWATPFWQ